MRALVFALAVTTLASAPVLAQPAVAPAAPGTATPGVASPAATAPHRVMRPRARVARSMAARSAGNGQPIDVGPNTPAANRAYQGGGVILQGQPGGPAPVPEATPPGQMPRNAVQP